LPSVTSALTRRLAELERRCAPLTPREPEKALSWLAWVSNEDLDWMEAVLRGGEPTTLDAQRIIAIEAEARRRMMFGEPPA
jgi:hypothetical protein